MQARQLAGEDSSFCPEFNDSYDGDISPTSKKEITHKTKQKTTATATKQLSSKPQAIPS